MHISKLGGGKRIDRVEDVRQLGDEIEVRVEDIDPNGKISLTPSAGARGPRRRGGGGGGCAARVRPTTAAREFVSFEDNFDEELRAELGDLGPESSRRARGRPVVVRAAAAAAVDGGDRGRGGRSGGAAAARRGGRR